MIITNFSLKNKKALVTGGNTGIGLGIAKGLAEAGAEVTILGRSKRKNAKALAQLKKIKTGCRAFEFDLENTDGIPSFYAALLKKSRGFDILVNNAGIQCRGRADLVKTRELERVLRINVTAPFTLSQCFARDRIGRKQPGSIIFIASLMSEAARPGVSAYTASKGAIRQMTKALAVDFAESGIRVNGIGPGYIRTEMTEPLHADPDFDAWVKKRTPLKRWGEPSDLAGAAVFLASDAARFITGQLLYVDGGFLASL